MTIHLGHVYRRVGELLNEAGYATTSYTVDIEWWNHRYDVQRPECRIWIGNPLDESFRAPSFDGALIAMQRELEHRSGRVPAPDVVVETDPS